MKDMTECSQDSLTEERLNEWLECRGFESTVVEDKYSYYDYDSDEIGIGFEPPSHVKYYRKFCNKLGLKVNGLDWKTLAFLHELGHAETLCELTLLDIIGEYVKIFTNTVSNSEFMLRLKANIYYRTGLEIKATKWAIGYINSHYKDVIELDNIMKNLELK